MKIIGVTGGIGTGKSTVSSILKNLGAKIIDADMISRQIVSKGKRAYLAIVESFGPEILDENEDINRRKLGEIVFNDKSKLEVLNAITHPIIADEIKSHVTEEMNNGFYDKVVVDAAIPFKVGFLDLVDEVWVVTASRENRIKRTMERNGISEEAALCRINSQMLQIEYATIGDNLIENDGDIIELEQKVVKLYFNG